jgi:hypothetical protein
MFERHLVILLLIAAAIGAPIVYHERGSRHEEESEVDKGVDIGRQFVDSPFPLGSPENPLHPNLEGSGTNSRHSSRNLSGPVHSVPSQSPFRTTGFAKRGDVFQESPASLNQLDGMEWIAGKNISNPLNSQNGNSISTQHPSPGAEYSRTVPRHTDDFLIPPPGRSPIFQKFGNQNRDINKNSPSPIVPGPVSGAMTPDYGAARTMILPGDEHGPDFTAQPLEIMPIPDFREFLNFDLTKNQIQRRWKRVSTNPRDYFEGLNGMRVPLVTGTNSWDLHGSLTYFFDAQQQLQRITFRGWTGDPQRLIQLLQDDFQFKSQPTHLAAFYLAKNRQRLKGALMSKTPSVIDQQNHFQQFGIVMEVNRIEGKFELSEEFRSLIAGSHPE